MTALTLLEILYLNNATILPAQAEELACNGNIIDVETVGRTITGAMHYICCNEIIDDTMTVCDCGQKIDWSE